MNYPLRFPLSGMFSKLFGVTLSIRVAVIYDTDAKVFIATSKDIDGLILEGETLAILKDEISVAIPDLLDFMYAKRPARMSADMIFVDHIPVI